MAYPAMRANIASAPAMVAATDEIRMSRWSTWFSSWARTPLSSSRSITRSKPSVTATAAWLGERPVAKAFGCTSGIT